MRQPKFRLEPGPLPGGVGPVERGPCPIGRRMRPVGGGLGSELLQLFQEDGFGF
jgi:hypothetical protein